MKKAMIIAVLVSMGGCVDREMTITSEPTGPRVEISGVDVGTTPLRKSFP
ncbi:MAG: PEGA domain-containing protein [Planctomycetota bacterium]|nr:PEGA domain-containing protein [Planctomycetota bacterium]